MLTSNGIINLKISVVICCYTADRLKDIFEAIDSAMAQTLKPHEVIVSVDHNRELFQRLKSELPPEVKLVLSEGTPGLSATRNVAINAASGEIITFLDDDAIAEKNWLENLAPAFENPGAMAVGGEIVPTWPKGKPPFWFPMDFDFVIGGTNHKKLILQANGEIRNVNGGNIALRKRVFDTLGGWETKLGRCETGNGQFNPTGGEEAELCLRIKNHIPGGLILFKPEAVVHHKINPERATIKYVFNYSFREGVTRAMMKKIVSHYGDRPLVAENLYLRRLLGVSIPRKLAKFYKLAPVAQVCVLIVNLSLMSIGYLVGKWQYRKSTI